MLSLNYHTGSLKYKAFGQEIYTDFLDFLQYAANQKIHGKSLEGLPMITGNSRQHHLGGAMDIHGHFFGYLLSFSTRWR
ncbi:hypothetical protein C5167_003008 [Papaver somniferum]|uniref:Uncharacterized protein n=1 Tax=Papaver somniferum TaxID=3469 RepID=A0A4Y7L1F8_PAPSO|nr:hypothetical protein C5167_003008 [Papaver somniferum]